MYKIIIPLLLMFISCTHVQQATQSVVYLQNNSIKIGVLPAVGGRMVFYGEPIGENMLLSDSSLWNEPLENRMIVEPEASFKPYFGLITWVGPQSEWWSHQDVIPSKKGNVWPPDPYLIYSSFVVSELTDTSIILTGPESPISGVQLTKYFVLEGNVLKIKVEAKNIRKTSVAWDLWSNARFDAFTKFKVPCDSSGIVKINTQENTTEEELEVELKDGYFTTNPQQPSDSTKRRVLKAFLYPKEGKIFVNKNSTQLCIEFNKVPFELIHSEQALVEVYNCVDSKGVETVLELEHHSAYTNLEPSEVMELTETWSLTKHDNSLKDIKN